jgi:hypothetical protein
LTIEKYYADLNSLFLSRLDVNKKLRTDRGNKDLKAELTYFQNRYDLAWANIKELEEKLEKVKKEWKSTAETPREEDRFSGVPGKISGFCNQNADGHPRD